MVRLSNLIVACLSTASWMHASSRSLVAMEVSASGEVRSVPPLARESPSLAARGRFVYSHTPSKPKESQRRVYMDMGANWANSLRLFKDMDFYNATTGPWEVYAFEASPIIKPYVDKFCAWLSGDGPKPPLTVPPSGSTMHMELLAPKYGCARAEKKEMRACMLQVFAEPISKLKPDPAMEAPSKVQERMASAAALAAHPLGLHDRDRFVFVPAAVGAKNGSITFSGTPSAMLYGGGRESDSGPISGAHITQETPVVDAVSWLVQNFREEDFVMVKMDIEGAEYELLQALLDAQHDLIDVLYLECHPWFRSPSARNLPSCPALIDRMKKETKTAIVLEHTSMAVGAKHDRFKGWDSFSGPDKYYPEMPVAGH